MKKFLIVLVLPAFFMFQFCSSGNKASKAPVAKVNFEDNVKPIISQKCGPCHTTGMKEHYIQYDLAVKKADEIIKSIQLNPGEKGFMPNKRDKLPDSLINVIVAWKNDGLLEQAQP